MPKAGELISATQNTATSTQASGVWNLNQAYDFVRTNQWPNATGIGRSLIFNADDSAYLSRTPATAGNRKTWTWSGWVKLASPGTNRVLFGASADSDNRTELFFYDNDALFFEIRSGANFVTRNYPGVKFRDPSAWYHVVAVFDSENSNSDDRQRLYVNGELLEPNQVDTITQGLEGFVNSASVEHEIGLGLSYSSPAFDGYMAEINFIDGEALEPDEFGRVDPEFGHWVPRRYSGNYGTNGFYLDFSDSSSNSALGTDKSGNANDWTPNNFNSAEDLVTDSPSQYGTDFGRGGEVRGNFATMNPLDKKSEIQILNGNLDMLMTVNANGGVGVRASLAVDKGKWYWETSPTFLADARPIYFVGIDPTFRPIGSANNGVGSGRFPDSYAYTSSSGKKITNSSSTAYGEVFGVSDVIGVALDMDNGTIEFFKNGVSQGIAFRNIIGRYAPSIGLYTDAASSPMKISGFINFGQKPFAYPAPEGFRCLTTRNLDQPSIVPGNYFNTVLYTGNSVAIGSGGQEITGVRFEPNWVWIRERSSASGHLLFDQIRGANNYLSSHSTAAESTSTEQLASFDTDGFTVGSSGAANESGQTYVAWNWKANGAGVTNSDGSITATVSASPESGFSIVSYTGNGTAGSTVGHGLDSAPDIIIGKRRSNTSNWWVGGSILAVDETLYLNLTNATDTVSVSTISNTLTGTTFELGTDTNRNANGDDFIAYCFHSVEGYSAFGSYTGNGSSDGPFVYTGFRPAFVMVKRTDLGNNWIMQDSERNQFNVVNLNLLANSSSAENTNSGFYDFTSNGFKCRDTDGGINASGGTYIYMAFAETPFKLSRAR